MQWSHEARGDESSGETDGRGEREHKSCARVAAQLPMTTTCRDQGDVSPDVLSQALEACVRDTGSVQHYIVAYKELSRFFHSLGSVFSFVAKDVDSKITLLESYRSDPDTGSKYETFQSMIKYEESEKLLRDTKRPSGARTVLRLHRALQFFSEFMDELAQVPGSSGTSHLARDCYRKTLAPHHSWVIQKSASLAMYALPARDQLLSRSFGQSPDMSEQWQKQSETMMQLARLSRQVYDLVQDLFAENSLLELP